MAILETKSNSPSVPPADLAVGTTPCGRRPTLADQTGKPWLRRPDEPCKAYAAFKLYYEMREQRSLDAVAKNLKKGKSQLGTWSRDHQWVARADAYLDWLAEIEQEVEERLARQDAEMWVRRKRERRERKWATSEKWLEISDRTDKFPPVEQKQVAEKYEDGRPHITNVLKPLKRDSIRYGQAGFALGDEVIREATASSEMKQSDTFEDVPLEPAQKEPK